MHAALRDAGWYCPAAQLVHELWPVPLNLPAGHVSQARLICVLVNLPPGQLVQFRLLENWPAGHTATHCDATTGHAYSYTSGEIFLPVKAQSRAFECRVPLHLAVTLAGNGHDSSLVMG